jgi:ABC-type bacteriocin/lantibiotic exporter with double-glycine peptidase domain
MIIVMSLLDMIGVASIMPFMVLAANPQRVESNALLKAAYSGFNFKTPEQLLLALGILVLVLLLTSLAFKSLTTYAQLRFIAMREYSLGLRLVEGYLYQPYSWFLNRHGSDLGKTILSEVNQVINHALVPMINLVAQGAVAIALLILLIITDPLLALSSGTVLAIAYSVIFKLMSNFLAHIGGEAMRANQARFSAISEAFGATKELKVRGMENIHVHRFSVPAQIYASHQSSAQAIRQLPRFVMEALAFGGMILLMLLLMRRDGGLSTALPIITLYALASYRLMPALQQIYASLTLLRFAGPSLDALHNDLMSLKSTKNGSESITMIPIKQAITLDNIHYTYPNAAQAALKGISLTIPALYTVGLVGATGSGKTTLVDLMLGLLEAQQGSMKIDGKIIDKYYLRAWQLSIGYVPQQIYLADDTVAANIAFGTDPRDINQQAVERAAKIANLHDFVINKLPKGYQTTVGERGVRLSGGQRQRIGIARSLYHKPQVLILDEATSALDNLTEQAVMEALHNLGHDITVIIIAHRLSTVRECDIIFLLENGILKDQGTFDELTKVSTKFREMAALHR